MSSIYTITDQTNGKQYVGFTERTVRHRWNQHIQAAKQGSSMRIHKAMREHGVLNFTVETIVSGGRGEMLLREIAEIEDRKTLAPDGYNSAVGGLAPLVTPETRAMMKKVWEKEEHWLKCSRSQTKRWTPEARAMMGRRRRGDDSPTTKLTEEKVREMRHLHAMGMTYKGLGEKYGVDLSTARNAVLGISWGHIT